MPWRKINSHRGFVGGRWGSEQTSAGATGSPPGIRRRKAGTDHRTVVADHGDGNTRRIPLRTAEEGVPREARERRALPPPDRLERGLSSPRPTIAGYNWPHALPSSPFPQHWLPYELIASDSSKPFLSAAPASLHREHE